MGQAVETDRPLTRQEVARLLDQHYQSEERGLLLRAIRTRTRECYVERGVVAVALLVIIVLVVRYGPYPYPIVYDPDGRIIWHGTAATTREERFTDVRLIEWITKARSLSSDESRVVQDREEAGAMVYGEAAKKFAAYNKASIATYRDVAKGFYVKIDLARGTFTRKGKDQVEITWWETWTPRMGSEVQEQRWQATVTYAWYARPPKWTDEQARKNPARVYVTEYTWGEIEQGVR